MAFDKAKTHLEQFGFTDRIVVTEHSSATVSEAAEASDGWMSVSSRKPRQGNDNHRRMRRRE